MQTRTADKSSMLFVINSKMHKQTKIYVFSMKYNSLTEYQYLLP